MRRLPLLRSLARTWPIAASGGRTLNPRVRLLLPQHWSKKNPPLLAPGLTLAKRHPESVDSGLSVADANPHLVEPGWVQPKVLVDPGLAARTYCVPLLVPMLCDHADPDRSDLPPGGRST